MLATLDRRTRLDAAITEMAADSVFTPVVTRLGCVRGIATLTAFGLATEIGDWDRALFGGKFQGGMIQFLDPAPAIVAVISGG